MPEEYKAKESLYVPVCIAVGMGHTATPVLSKLFQTRLPWRSENGRGRLEEKIVTRPVGTDAFQQYQNLTENGPLDRHYQHILDLIISNQNIPPELLVLLQQEESRRYQVSPPPGTEDNHHRHIWRRGGGPSSVAVILPWSMHLDLGVTASRPSCLFGNMPCTIQAGIIKCLSRAKFTPDILFPHF